MRSSQTTLLYIEDDPAVARALTRLLTPRKIEVTTVTCIEEALTASKHSKYHVVLSDLHLQDECGTQALLKVKEQLPDALFFLTSGQPDYVIPKGGADAFVSGVFSKPFDVDAIIAAIDRARQPAPSPTAIRYLAIGAQGLLDADPDLAAASECVDAWRAASALVYTRNYDVILLSLDLPDSRGTEPLARLRAVAPEAALVVMAPGADEAEVEKLLGLGADEVIDMHDFAPRARRLIRAALERKRAQKKWLDRARRDPLTGLLNRSELADRFSHAHSLALRTRSSAALFFVDLNGFKTVNDTYGHDVGDALLVEVASRFLGAVRDCDTLARLGGDEFALLVENVRDDADLGVIASRLKGALAEPIVVGGQALKVGASIGFASSTPDNTATSFDELLKTADHAMYAQKRGRPTERSARSTQAVSLPMFAT